MLPTSAPISGSVLSISPTTSWASPTIGTGRWMKTNAAFAKHLGFAPTELLGVRVSSLVHPDDLSRCETAARVMAAGNRHVFAGRMRTKSGG